MQTDELKRRMARVGYDEAAALMDEHGPCPWGDPLHFHHDGCPSCYQDEMMTINDWTEVIHTWAQDKGWWDEPRDDGTLIALMHSELSEALEGLREGNPPSEKIPEFSQLEEELADVVIRIFDYAGAKGLDLQGAIEAKHDYNGGREYRHGGKKF